MKSTLKVFRSAPDIKYAEKSYANTKVKTLNEDYWVFPDNSSTVYDNESLRLSIGWPNTSSIDRVEIRYSYDNTTWSQWKIATKSEDNYYIDVDESEWKQYVGSQIYWEANRTDIDDNSTIYGIFIAYLGDDDTTPPRIYDISIVEDMDHVDGKIEADDYLYIDFYIEENSGLKNVSVYYELNGQNRNLTIATIENLSNIYHLKTETFCTNDSGGMTITIVAWDNDNDDWTGDNAWKSETMTVSVQREILKIEVDPYEPIINYTSEQQIFVDIYRDDDGIPLDGLPVNLLVLSEGSCLYSDLNITYSASTQFVLNPSQCGLGPGQYDMNVTFNGSNVFAPSFNASWIHVKIETAIEVAVNDTMRYGEHVTITIHLWQQDENNTPLAYRHVEVYLNSSGEYILLGSNYTDEDGVALIYWKVNHTPSTISLVAVYEGHQHYYGSQDTKTITILKGDITILCDTQYTLIYTDGGKIIADVLDEFGDKVSGITIYLKAYVNESWRVLAINDTVDGKIVFSFSNLEGHIPPPNDLLPGAYTLVFRFNGNDYFNPKQVSSELQIEKEILEEVKIDLNSTEVEWGDALLITINATDNDGQGIIYSSAKVALIADGGTLYISTESFNNGFISITIPIKFQVGLNITVNVTIITTAYDMQNTNIDERWFVIIQERVNIEATGNISDGLWRVKYGISSSINLILVDNDEKYVEGGGLLYVRIEGVGVNISFNISYDGYNITLKYPLSIDLLPSIYTFKILHIYTDNYTLNNTYEIILEVVKITTYSTLDYVDLTYSDYGIIKVGIYDELGEGVGNVLVLAYIGDLLIQNVTDSNGSVVFCFLVTLTPGNFQLTINWGGTKIHNGGNSTYTIEVGKENLEIDLKIGGELVVWGDAHIEVNITDDDGDPVAGIHVVVYAGDLVVYNGTYDAPLRIYWSPHKEGDVLITVEVMESDYYNKCVASEKVQIGEGKETTGRFYVALSFIITISLFALYLSISKILKRRKARMAIKKKLKKLSDETDLQDL